MAPRRLVIVDPPTGKPITAVN
ncbi:99585e52-d85a-4d40-a240-081e4c0e287c [Thermothielavioides terrestris]|uniref:99585e52-d85a-4d40-a240-081e4c0e287c n=1 Tax=Thermothielavioides terrestris TaxID=2587410 RepID=A0A446BH21_9PEZI|nr:99585e52-d85a-4d40-a240-081e4c0e287c [Thermothielavioides terrestris]